MKIKVGEWKWGRLKYVLASLLGSTANLCAGQTPPVFSEMYYQNQYIANPAMAGLTEGLKINLAFRQQWSPMPGSPKNQLLSTDYNGGKKVGLGLLLMNDEAGLIKRTRAMATYSYHLPFNDVSQKLSFGISFGLMDERVMNEGLNGDPGDVSVSRFNQRATFVDGDFGVGFTSSKLTLQAVLPNLKGLASNDQFNSANRYTYYSAASYRFEFPSALNGLGVEPKVALRGVSGLEDILDLGANVTVADKTANLTLLYQSSKNAVIGFGATVKSLGSFNVYYSTPTNALEGEARGNFELSLLINLLKSNQNKNE